MDASIIAGEEAVRLWTPAREARVTASERREVEVTIIRPGTSSNGHEYPEDVLRRSLPLWEGATAFCDHPGPLDAGRAGGRSVRDVVGVYGGARWENGVCATLRIYPHATWLYDLIAAAIGDRAAGRPAPDIGISADMVVALSGPHSGGAMRVEEIRRVNSADVVFRPAAGGRFERLLNGLGPQSGGIQERGSGEREDDAPQSADGVERGDEARMATKGGREMNVREGKEAVSSREGDGASAKEVELCGALLEARLGASGLTELARAQLRKRFEGRSFEATELDGAIGEVQALLAEAASGSVVKGAGLLGSGGALARVGATPRQKIEAALGRLFGLEPSAGMGDVPRLSGIREAYILITGDREFTGRYHWSESVLREADEVTTSVMADALANVMNKRLVKDYQGQARWWERICVRVPLRDMKEQARVLLSDFASLSTVGENAAYANLAWGDTKETYTPEKKGGLVYVTLETIINDDLRAVASIPKKLAVAANITINEYVSALFTTGGGQGPAMSDTNRVVSAAHNNYVTSALDATTLQAGIVAMWKQTNSASKRLGLHPRFLLVPPDLLLSAITLTSSHLKPGTANNDINVLEGLVEPLSVPNWTDANNWYLMADPNQIECLELGFLNGREEPELLVQDNPTAGSVFTNDAITFKVRHIYGGNWLDYRGVYGAVVA